MSEGLGVTSAAPATLKKKNLFQAADELINLSMVARKCARNFAWLNANVKPGPHHDTRSILLLDFDIICGALPRFATDQLVQRFEADDSDALVQDLVGPHALRLMLRELDDYSLPPGALAELLAWRGRLEDGLGRRAEGFVTHLAEAQHSARPIDQLIEYSKNLSGTTGYTNVLDLVKHEVAGVVSDFGDVELLDTVLNRGRPWESLIESDLRKSEHRHEVKDVYLKALAYLKTIRSRREMSNLHDATNVAFLVYLFNSRLEQSPCPILISESDWVQGFDIPPGKLSVESARSAPSLINSQFYLPFSSALLQRCGGLHRAARDEAENLANDLGRLAESYLNVVHPEDDTHGDEVAPSDLDWELLQHDRFRLFDTWQDVLAPGVWAASQDRELVLSQLVTPQIEHELTSSSVESQKSGLQKCVARLMAYEGGGSTLWSHVVKYSKKYGRTKHDLRTPSSFDIVESCLIATVIENDGTLLRDCEAGVPLMDCDISLFQRDHDVRVAIMPRFVERAAMIAFDSQRENDTHEMSVVWTHHRPATVGLVGLNWLDTVRTAEGGLELTAMFDGAKKTWQGSLKEAHSSLRRTVSEHPNIDFVSGKSGAFSFFADLRAVHETEQQMALRFPVAVWTDELQIAVAKAIQASGERTLPRQGLRAILSLIRELVLNSKQGSLPQ